MNSNALRKGPGRPNSDIMRTPELYREPWSCGECGKTLSELSSLLRHGGRVHNIPYMKLDKKRNVGYPIRARNEHPEGMVGDQPLGPECGICKKRLKTPQGLAGHLQLAHGKRSVLAKAYSEEGSPDHQGREDLCTPLNRSVGSRREYVEDFTLKTLYDHLASTHPNDKKLSLRLLSEQLGLVENYVYNVCQYLREGGLISPPSTPTMDGFHKYQLSNKGVRFVEVLLTKV